MKNNLGSNPFYKALWKLPILPKVALFIWKCHENIIPTKSVLARYNNTHDSLCSMCNSNQIETPEHLLLHCLFARSVWALTPYADLIEQDIASSLSIPDWVIKWTMNNSLKDKAIVDFTIAWSIWKDRCFHTFQEKALNHFSTARLALKLVNDTKIYLKNDTPLSVPSHDLVEEKNLSYVTVSLPHDCVILFCDAAFDKDTKFSGIGLILIDISGYFIGCKLKARSVRNAEEAESLSILEAVQWAKEKSLQKICFISDAKLVIESLNSSSNQLYWYNIPVINDCKTLASNFCFLNLTS
ncbi:uncharacterized protein LOC113296107 [Papaver somniferum]|uniref:uncharacterized protein LOC113296107 n=1 Tax=Papaver somniferum TaxID=3469 RepID=UPI000E703F39|nr:uncharacterized protein LOC113296107 [Papaver somniferum]